VIVGVGQSLRRPTRAEEMAEPLDLMLEAARAAADDSGAGQGLLARIPSVRVVESMSWRTPDPGAVVGEKLGMTVVDSLQTATGGNSPQMLVNMTAAAIAAGRLDGALVVGAEAMYSRRVARKLGGKLETVTQPADTPKAHVVGLDRSGSHPAELARLLMMPTQVYPVFENAVRAASGATIEEHQQKIAGLWSRFSEVAATNPWAWSPQARTAAEVGMASPENRMIGFPYPKLMNANIQVDQGAALILCSAEVARAAGVPEDRWVFPLAGADAHDHWFVSERDNLHSSPAIRECGKAAFALAGAGPDDVAHVDLYSCFPVAVEIAAAELGFSLDRQLSLTGGLTFGGGPGNNYVTHSIAQAVIALRTDPGSVGLVNANGWYVTKHSVGLYGTTPPGDGFRAADVQAAVDATPKREVVEDAEGAATVESYTVMHDRDGAPETAIVACLLPDGRRAWANSTDPDLLTRLTTEDVIGHPAVLRAAGLVEVL
ncbi:MAG TPA: acetyl-CoA acetyltransferase, partial [Acidimicrobiales bacterium]|nr:acetyl-CoA acetyltransferase [Acidimicrobiales bacterium]